MRSQQPRPRRVSNESKSGPVDVVWEVISSCYEEGRDEVNRVVNAAFAGDRAPLRRAVHRECIAAPRMQESASSGAVERMPASRARACAARRHTS